MTTSTRNIPRRVLAALLGCVLAVAGLAVSVGPASAATWDRLAGVNRYETASDIAGATFPDGATDVVLATGENFPDALAAAGMAGARIAPVLLTGGQALSPETETALGHMDPDTVHIIGGTAAVDAAVEAELDALGYATPRVAGADRYETAALIAAEIGADNVAGSTALIATGNDFPDALAGGPLAYAGPIPILLVHGIKDEVPTVTAEALTDLDISEIVILGGVDVISDDLKAELEDITGDAAAERLAGPSRYETAAEIADYAVGNLGFDLSTVLIANGVQNIGVDALAGGPHGGAASSPILLVTRDLLPSGTETFVSANAQNVDAVRALGGPAVISDSVLEAVAAAATPATQAFDVSPGGDATLAVVPEAQTDTEADDRHYTVTGTIADAAHTIALFPADDVMVTADGSATFADLDENGVADGYGDAAAASIVAVNGASVDQGGDATAVPVAGAITFVIDGVAPGSVVPVVFADADAGADLDLDADDAPSEAFGVGGASHYRPPSAGASADAADGRVTFMDPDTNEIWVDIGSPAGDFAPGDADVVYAYDDTDVFAVAGVPGTVEEFEQSLSGGDELHVTAYATDEAPESQFDIIVDTPLAPTSVEADAGDDGATDDITITVVPSTPSAPALYDAFVVERALVSGGTDETADGTVGSYVPIATTTSDADPVAAGFQYVDQDVDAGVYRYRAAGVIDGDVGAFTEDLANEASVTPPEPDTTAPTVETAAVTADNDLLGIVTGTDAWTLTFSEDIDPAAASDGKLLLDDADGDRIEAECGRIVDATDELLSLSCEPSDGDATGGNEIVTVSLSEQPRDINPDGNGTIEYPLTIVSISTHFGDGTNSVDLVGSADVLIDAG